MHSHFAVVQHKSLIHHIIKMLEFRFTDSVTKLTTEFYTQQQKGEENEKEETVIFSGLFIYDVNRNMSE
ncbi:CLUMA_CG021108, isoform A [Clunio marinus]|uniref:CLUMA_CG021108, isoform A n=1 Tax=Clunio marinus TaxID=568069 RepID=A0A1J1J6F9_9DIPT|nr:CLUMA_CG021108, isoform A [Clunio marinus]